MKSLLVLCALAPLAVVLHAADAAAEIRDAEQSWANAVLHRDYAALNRIFSDRLIYAHSTGAIQNKQEYLDRLRSGAQRYDSIVHESTRVVPYGDAAVSHSILRMTGVSNGKPFNDHVMALHLWVRQDGRWVLAAHQTTKLPE